MGPGVGTVQAGLREGRRGLRHSRNRRWGRACGRQPAKAARSAECSLRQHQLALRAARRGAGAAAGLRGATASALGVQSKLPQEACSGRGWAGGGGS